MTCSTRANNTELTPNSKELVIFPSLPKMKQYTAVVVALALISMMGPALSQTVGCMTCNSLNVQCVSKDAVMTCLGTPRLIRCPAGTFCNVNLLPWCEKTHTPLCPR